jgi:hypothetical protein
MYRSDVTSTEQLPPWPGRSPLRSMPRLRSLRLLGGVDARVLGALLQDAAGCAQLQELELVADELDSASGGPAEPSSWEHGLLALARGAARLSLRRLVIKFERGYRCVPGKPCSAATAAFVASPGQLPMLQEPAQLPV